MAATRKLAIFALLTVAFSGFYCQTGDIEQQGCSGGGGMAEESQRPPSAAAEYLQYISSGGQAQAGDSEQEESGGGVGAEESQSAPTAVDLYLQYITNRGKLYDDDQVQGEDEEMGEEVEYDWGSWIMSTLMDHYYQKFKRRSRKKIKANLRKVIKRMDTNKDGKVTKEELVAWLTKVARKGAILEANKQGEMGPSDLNKDGKMSWDELYKDMKSVNKQGSADFQRLVDLDKVKFRDADKDGDGFLDKKEYRYWISPDYFEQMEGYQAAKHIYDFDLNNDKKVSMEEYMSGDLTKLSQEDIEKERKRFEAMDTNHDGLVSLEEMTPESSKFFVGSVLKDHADKMIKKGDTDGDGVLTKKEILKNYQFFTKEITEEVVSDVQGVGVPGVAEQIPAHKHSEL